MAYYTVRYYDDIVRYHETQPCHLNDKTYHTALEAEIAAKAELSSVRAKLGPNVGYAVFEDQVRAVAIGPGVYDDA